MDYYINTELFSSFSMDADSAFTSFLGGLIGMILLYIFSTRQSAQLNKSASSGSKSNIVIGTSNKR